MARSGESCEVEASIALGMMLANQEGMALDMMGVPGTSGETGLAKS